MNNEQVIENAKKLKEELLTIPEVKEYFYLKKLFEDSEELQKMREEIIHLELEKKSEEKKALLEKYNSHPLVNNFNIAKEEIKDLLSSIQKILSD